MLQSQMAAHPAAQAPEVDVVQDFIGISPAFEAARAMAASVARRRSTVLIQGETGSGKEMLAGYIHRCSERAQQPFVPVDCSALSEGLLESELFGHVKGAFTGALRDSLGFIRSADGGTLFLDEIGEMPLPLQAKLLRVLQERKVVPVGEHRGIPVHVRVIAATNRDLKEMVRLGKFRADLYFRLNVISVRMPPLRERIEDVLPLARHLLALQAAAYDEPLKQIATPAAEALKKYPWPGNVRELSNAIEHAHILCDGELIELHDLPEAVRNATDVRRDDLPGINLRLVDVERRAIIDALKRSKHSKAAASRLLGINIQRLNRRIVRLGITLP
jgi:transcriptional regulator with PAS, ATPase and Fis domain